MSGPSPRWLAVLPIVGALELVAELALSTREVPVDAWAALPTALAELAPLGTPVVVSPRWAEPHARAAIGDTWMPLGDVAHSGLETRREVVEVSLGGRRDPTLARLRERRRVLAGPLELRLLENPAPEPVVFDFVEALAPGRAVVFGTTPSRSCRFQPRARVLTGGLSGHPTLPRERFDCGEGGWSDVGVTVIADERFLPRRCIFAHPPALGERVIRYDDARLGAELVVDAGMYWMIEREQAGAPVSLEVRIDGDPLSVVVHRDGEGWTRTRLALGAHAGKARASVELRISSEDLTRRHFCFRADSR